MKAEITIKTCIENQVLAQVRKECLLLDLIYPGYPAGGYHLCLLMDDVPELVKELQNAYINRKDLSEDE